MKVQREFLRFASPNEQRTISREDLGFYHAVIVGAVYEFGDGFSIDSPSSLFGPLTRCIEQHPFLGVVVGDRHANKSYYERPAQINLEDHVEVLDPVLGEGTKRLDAIEQVQRSDLDRPFSNEVPPWRIIVLPLANSEYFIAFSFSHMLGDGLTGPSMHRSLLNAFRSASANSPPAPSVITTPRQPLGVPFDTPQRLPISWTFLLGPLIAYFFPQFLANLLGLKPQVATLDDGTWTGPPAFFDPEKCHTRIMLRLVDASAVQKALREARLHDAKLTGFLHQAFVRGMSKALGGPDTTNFVSQTSVNMRNAVGIPRDEMGEFVSGKYISHPKNLSSGPLSEEEWAAARLSTRELAEAASTLQDQPIGLLRYVSSIRSWLNGKLGQRRDCSLEVSNIGAFEDEDSAGAGKAKINLVVFSQPGHVSSAPICFNLASVKSGSLAYTVTWPTGALGINESEEEIAVRSICESIDDAFATLP
ncbi:l-amino acid oxidase [Colletotrichum plurivorum]|uniref:L-amino acid oxidase n=1 Tax=Colletotrichum plurivorum TaxID=2175906 RepID=A0A8H6KH96_9PEZI|nr:l-amino acid oxidase [Colletotrichum plurivorum]